MRLQQQLLLLQQQLLLLQLLLPRLLRLLLRHQKRYNRDVFYGRSSKCCGKFTLLSEDACKECCVDAVLSTTTRWCRPVRA